MNEKNSRPGRPKIDRHGVEAVHVKLSSIEAIACLARLQGIWLTKNPGHPVPRAPELVGIALRVLEDYWLGIGGSTHE